MKNKIFKISVILVMILVMTMTNFIFVGSRLISYAVDNKSTNHANVEFEAYFKNEKGEEVTTLERILEGKETYLYLRVNVKKEGYFNGEISLSDSNFILKESDSGYVSKIDNNTVYLNQINMGVSEEIKVKIEPIVEENFQIGLLNMISKISIKGIYRDSTQKNINIQANRDLTLKLIENDTSENVLNEMRIITNKIIEIDGQEKRMIQFSYHIGLKENSYPIQKINAKITIPVINGKQAEIHEVTYLNNMTSLDYTYDGNIMELVFVNEPTEDGMVMWKRQGSESVILTCLFDKEAENIIMNTQEKITLYNNKELETINEMTVGTDEIDSIIEISANNSEEMMYKGKICAGIDRQYQSTTQLKINFANTIQNIAITEENSQFVVNDISRPANIIYNKTILKKEQFDKLFGENGIITIYDSEEEVIGAITNATPIDQQGNIVIDYEGKEVSGITIQTTTPVEEGILEFEHVKTIQSNSDIVKEATELKNSITAKYNGMISDTIETSIRLENTVTKATLEINKDSLSTVIANDVEIKVVLVSNDEKYDLHKNTQIAIELPEQVENIAINSVDFLYENELKIRDYIVNGRTLNIYLEGDQTQYKEEVIEGATIIINATITVNRKATTKNELIKMTYSNEKAVNYEEDNVGIDSKEIKIEAPTDMTIIHSIQDLGVETLGQEESKPIMISRGIENQQLAAQLQIINNREENVKNVKILGDFPTDDEQNNMGIQITQEMELQGIDNAKVYYSENANATDELENAENEWKETVEDGKKVNKYLIVMEELEAQSSVEGSYQYQIPANLEYNQEAVTGYQVAYTNESTNVESELEATAIKMETGVGPVVTTNLTATVRGEEISGSVKNGEVIKYRIEVANTGTEDVENIVVTGDVPEGTTMVQPEEDYEYSGASYYEELDNKVYEAKIDNLKVGEVVYKEYEVRVNEQVAEGTTLSNKAQIGYSDVIKQSDEIKNVTSKGNLRVTIKRITDRTVDLYTAGTVQYFAIIENISDKIQENVTVRTNLPGVLKVDRLSLITGMKKEDETQMANSNVKSELLEYKEGIINIGAIEPGKNKVLSYDMLINQTQDSGNQIDFSVKVNAGKEEYQSNNWQDNIVNMDITMSMTTNTESQYVSAGDNIEYTIVVKNNSKANTSGLEIVDIIPAQLTINKITVDGHDMGEVKGNSLRILPKMAEDITSSTIKIEAVVNYSPGRDRAEAITNAAYAEIFGKKVATTSEINHIIRANDGSTTTPGNNENNGNNGGNGNNQNGENNIENNDVAKGNRMITGVAWYDENANGKKEQGEKLLSNVKVKLLNVETNNLVKNENGEVLQATTNENGIYVLDKIGNGKYIVIFDYDNTQYALTKYQLDGVPEEENSNVILNEISIGNQKQRVASTDMIEVKDNNISNINIGFIRLQNFDLQLDKYVSRILIQNANGTIVKDYNNTSIAKIEIDAKKLKGSTVIIEYQIRVTNKGEIDGYAKKIVDYAPADLKFNSELNKDWYQVGNVLYTTSLANEKILPGQTKTVTLSLTKTMTEDNTGSIPNTAEIAEDYNELGIADSNSIPGNRAKNENDYGLAEVILSIRTGGIVYVTVFIMVVAILGVIAVIVLKNKNKSKEI